MRLFVATAGIDGSGKSTFLPLIASLIEEHTGQAPVVTREPGGTRLGEELRAILLGGGEMHVETETLLMYAARVEHVQTVIKPALAKGSPVLSDRFHDCTAAFQCANGLEPRKLAVLEQMLDGFKPDLTLLFDIPVSVGRDRIGGARELDRIESRGDLIHAHARDIYLSRAQAEPKRFALIDASQSMDAVEAEVRREFAAWVARQ